MWDALEHISEWGVAPKKDEQQTNRVGCDWGFVLLSKSPSSLFTPNLETKIKRGYLQKNAVHRGLGICSLVLLANLSCKCDINSDVWLQDLRG